MQATSQETAPLHGHHGHGGGGTTRFNIKRHQRTAIGITIIIIALGLTVASTSPFIPKWHPMYYPDSVAEQPAWDWVSLNSFYLVAALTWAFLAAPGSDDRPLLPAATLLCALTWASVAALVAFQRFAKGETAWFAEFDVLLAFALAVYCAWAGGLGDPVRRRGGDAAGGGGGGHPDEAGRFGAADLDLKRGPGLALSEAGRAAARMPRFRKSVLLVSAALYLAYCIVCLPVSLAFTHPLWFEYSDREDIAWEWDALMLANCTVIMAWAALRSGGQAAEETKIAACIWCCVVWAGNFCLMMRLDETKRLTGLGVFAGWCCLAVSVLCIAAARR